MHILEIQAIRDGRSLIRTVPDPILSMYSNSVKEFNEELSEFCDLILNELEVSRGVGIAAPQLGFLRRVIAYRDNPSGEGKIIVNPQITDASMNQVIEAESCLSIPNETVNVLRPALITVSGFDPSGKALTVKPSPFSSRVIQHEIDHLNGILITDYRSGGF